MSEPIPTPNLYKRLLSITEEIGKIEKTGNNTAQGYKFIEQARVVAEVRVQLAKHGVMIIPETVSRTIERHTTTKTGYQGKPDYEQASYHANVVSRYTLINIDNPEDKIVCEWDAGEALDTSDKATNKAVTASQKSYLMKLFNISDQDDPDGGSPDVPVEPPKSVRRPAVVGTAVKYVTSAQAAMLLGRAKQASGLTDRKDVLAFFKEEAGVELDKVKQDDVARIIAVFGGDIEVES